MTTSRSNVLGDETEYDPTDWTSRAEYDAWRAEAVRIDDDYEDLVDIMYYASLYPYIAVNPSAPVVDPRMVVPDLGDYSLESINSYFNNNIAGRFQRIEVPDQTLN
jgi:hypothetical protein